MSHSSRSGRRQGTGSAGHGRPAAPVVLFTKTQWQETKSEVALQLSKATYCNLLQEAEFGGVEGEKIVIHVPNRRAAEWINRRLAQAIARTAGYVAGCRGLTVEARPTPGANGRDDPACGSGTRPRAGTRPTPTTTAARVAGRAGREPP